MIFLEFAREMVNMDHVAKFWRGEPLGHDKTTCTILMDVGDDVLVESFDTPGSQEQRYKELCQSIASRY